MPDVASPPVPFEIASYVRWSDLDSNGHMANVGYLNAAVDCRMQYFASCGYPVDKLTELKVGPVVQRDEVDYRRELRLLQRFNVTITLAGMSPDGSRFRIRNRILLEDGSLVATVTSTTGWLDLARRRLFAPPPELFDVVDGIVRDDDFEQLRPLTSARG